MEAEEEGKFIVSVHLPSLIPVAILYNPLFRLRYNLPSIIPIANELVFILLLIICYILVKYSKYYSQVDLILD